MFKNLLQTKKTNPYHNTRVGGASSAGLNLRVTEKKKAIRSTGSDTVNTNYRVWR